MEDTRKEYDKHTPYLCYTDTEEVVYTTMGACKGDIVAVFSSGNGVIVRDFWNYYYKVTDITIAGIIENMEDDDSLLLIGENVLVNMRYIEAITSQFVQVAEHLIPTDDKIRDNIESYRRLVHEAIYNYDKICDEEEESDGYCVNSGHGYTGGITGYD